MSQIMHIVRKDVRRLRWILALWVAVLVARVALSSGGATSPDEAVNIGLLLRELTGALGTVELLLTALIVARLVHEEPLVGFTAFWLTRPYASANLLVAKLLFAAIVVVVLPLIADLTMMSLFGAGPQALVRAGSTAAAGYVGWTLSLMVIATVTPSLGAFVLTILGIVAGASILLASMFGLATLWADEPSGYSPPSVPDVTSGIVMLGVYLCAALCIIVYQYRYRRWRMATGVAIAGLVATIVVPMFWPWSFARGEAIRPGPWAASAAAIHDPSWGTEVSDVDRIGGGVPRRHVNARVTLSGTPPEVTVESTGVRSRLQFEDGTVVESGQMGWQGPAFSTAVFQAALGGVEVLNAAEADEQRQIWTPIITLMEDEYVRHRGRSGRLNANIDFHLVRTREVGTLPLTPGAALDNGLSRIEIVGTQRRTDSREVSVRQWHARSPFSTGRGPYQRFYALRHRSRGEAIMGGEETQWGMGGRGNAAMSLLRVPLAMVGFTGYSVHTSGGGFSVETSFLRFPGRSFGKAPRLDTTWYDDTELVVLEIVVDGVVTRPLTIAEFEIPE